MEILTVKSEMKNLIGAYFCKKNLDSGEYLNGAVVIDHTDTAPDFPLQLVESLQKSCKDAFDGNCDAGCSVAILKEKLEKIKKMTTSVS